MSGEQIEKRIEKVEKFLNENGYNVKMQKNETPIEYMDRLYELELDWESKNGKEFPV